MWMAPSQNRASRSLAGRAAGSRMATFLYAASGAEAGAVAEAVAGPAAAAPPTVQSSVVEVRLAEYRPLDDAYLYMNGRAYRMVGSSASGGYRSHGASEALAAAAYAQDAPTQMFRRQAMRWVADNVLRAKMAVLFGWAEAPAAVEVSGAAVENHGQLVIYLLPPAAGPQL